MGIKETLQARIEKNAVRSEMSWTDSNGEVHNESVILKRSKLPLIGDWARVYPPLNEDGSWNIMNTIFGGKQNFFKLLLIFIILGLIYYQVMGILGANAEFMDGDKYIIVEKNTFDKFCVMSISNGNTATMFTLPSNITIFTEKT